MLPLVTLADIQQAARRLRGVLTPTPLLPFPSADPPLLLKPESLQPTGSFKVRGAYAAISALPAAARQGGVVAHSSGNHAQAVAWAAGLLGVRAVVVIPENTPAIKAEATRRLGAQGAHHPDDEHQEPQIAENGARSECHGHRGFDELECASDNGGVAGAVSTDDCGLRTRNCS